MTEFTISFRILADGRVAVAEAGAVTKSIDKIGTGAAEASAEATAAVGKIGTELNGLHVAVAKAGPWRQLSDAGKAELFAIAAEARRTASGLGAIDTAAKTTTTAVSQIASGADVASAGLSQFVATSLQSLRSVELQAQTTGRTLSAALGMSGVRNLSQEQGQAQARAAMEQAARARLVEINAARAASIQAGSRAVVEALMAEARAATAAGAAQATAAQGARALAVSEAELQAVLLSIQTPQERHAEQLIRINALYEAGALTTTQYHRAVAAGNAQFATATQGASGLAGGLGMATKGLIYFEIARQALQLGKTAAAMQDLDTRLQGATAKTGDYAGAEAYLIQLATQHHKTLTDLTDGYTKLLALEESQIVTRKEAQTITAGLSNAQSALGASGSQLQQVMFGLGQALSSPVVHAEELNQVAEPLPGLLAKMDKAAGLTAGGFRQMVVEGKVTAQVFKDTLIKALADYDGAAERSANNISAKFRDIKREYELLAKTLEKPVTMLVDFLVTPPTKIIQAAREAAQSAGKALSAEDFLPSGGGLSEDKLNAAYEADIKRMLARAFPASSLPSPGSPQFVGPLPTKLLAYDEKFVDSIKGSDQKAIDAIRDDLAKLSAMRDEIVAKLGEAKYNEVHATLNQQLSQSFAKLRASGAQYDALFAKAQAEHPNLPQGLVKAVAAWESRDAFNPDALNNKTGAAGLMQIVPKTADWLGVANPYDPKQAIDGAAKYLDYLFNTVFKGDADALVKTIAAYNTGQGNVLKYGIDRVLSPKYAGGQTAEYVPEVLKRMAQYGNADAALVDIASNQKRFAEAEALYQAHQDRLVTTAQDTAKRLAEINKTALDELDRKYAADRNKRTEALVGATGADRRRIERENAIADAKDAEKYAGDRRKLELEAIGILNAEIDAKLKLAKADQDHAAEYGATAAERVKLDTQVGTLQNELVILAEKRKQIEVNAQKDIEAAVAKTAEAQAQARNAVLIDNQQAIQQAQQLYAAKSQTIQARLAAGLITQGQAQEKIRGIAAASAQAIEGNVVALKRSAETGSADAVLAYEQAQHALYDMLSSTRGPMDSLLADWRDTTVQMEQAATGWVSSAADELTRFVMGAKTDFKGLALSIIADFLRIQIQSRLFVPLMSAAGFGSPALALGASGAAAMLGGGAGSAAGLGVGAATGVGGVGATGTGAMGYAGIASGTAPLLTGMTSPLLAHAGYAAGNALFGAGTAGASVLGAGMYFSPYGAVAGLAANMLGLKGDSMIANMALPTAGAIAGGGLAATFGGAALTAAFGAKIGAAAGPIGAVLGAIIGAAISSMIHSAKPASSAQVEFGADNRMSVNRIWEHAGGKSDPLIQVASPLGATITGIERAFGVELGKIVVGMEQRGRNLMLEGAGAGGQFYSAANRFYTKKGEFDEEAMQAALDRFVAAMLKQRAVISQISDDLLKSAIKGSDTLTTIKARAQSVNNLRIFEGERSSISGDIDKLLTKYYKFTDRIAEYAGKKLQAIEQAKLDAALQTKWQAQIAGFQNSLSKLAGGPDSTVADAVRGILAQQKELIAQNKELEAAAQKSRGKLKYTPIDQAEIEKAVQAALESARTAMLKPLRDGVKNTIQAALDNIAGPSATLDRLNVAIGAGMAGLDAIFDPHAQQTKISEIMGLVDQRYQLELSQIQAQIAAAQNLKSIVSGLKLSDLSPLTPAQKLIESQGAWLADVAKFKGGDRSAELLTRLGTEGQAYLQQAREMYASAQPYTDAFNSVSTILNQAANSAGDERAQLLDLQKRTADTLDRLQTYLDKQAQSALDAAGIIAKNADINAKSISTTISIEADKTRRSTKTVVLK